MRRWLIWATLVSLGGLWVQWMSPRAPQCPPELADIRGVRLLYRYECGRCHQLDLPGMRGTMGPALTGIGGRRSQAYLRESLLQPGRRIAPGYLNGMPSFEKLDSQQLEELVEYLGQLR